MRLGSNDDSEIYDFLASLRKKGLELWVEGNNLRYRGASEVLTKELLEQLRLKKVEIVNALKSAVPKSREETAISKRKGDGPVRASFAQERLWFLEQLEPGGSHYNIPVSFRIKGKLDVVLVKECFELLVKRHEALRTRYEVVSGQVTQVVEETVSVGMHVEDVSLGAKEELEERVRRRCEEEGQLPFDLRNGPVFRVRVYRMGMCHWVLRRNWKRE